MNVYLIAAVVAGVLIAGSGWKGYRLGEDHVRAEVALSVEAARNEAEAKRAAEADKARKLAAGLQTALTKQKALANELGGSLAKHIAAMPKAPVGCPDPAISDSVYDDLNRAIQGARNAPGGKLPPATGAASPVDGKEPGGSGIKAR